MGAKTFADNTGYSLSVVLIVRRGDTPGSEQGVDSFSLAPGGSLFIRYSDSSNPYLDGISVNAVSNGNIIASQEFVIERGSSVDNDLNAHNTVTFGMQGDSIVLAFSDR